MASWIVPVGFQKGMLSYGLFLYTNGCFVLFHFVIMNITTGKYQQLPQQLEAIIKIASFTNLRHLFETYGTMNTFIGVVNQIFGWPLLVSHIKTFAIVLFEINYLFNISKEQLVDIQFLSAVNMFTSMVSYYYYITIIPKFANRTEEEITTASKQLMS